MKKIMLVVIMFVGMFLLSSCGQQVDSNTQVSVEFLEKVGISYKNAISVDSIGEWPVRVRVHYECENDLGKRFERYAEVVLRKGESYEVKYKDPNTTIIALLNYETELLPKTVNLEKFVLSVFAISLIISFVITLVLSFRFDIDGAGGTLLIVALAVLSTIIITIIAIIVTKLSAGGPVIIEILDLTI